MASVRLESVSKSFPGANGAGVKALDGVSLEVASGELLVVIGPSGSGKTTLLRIIAGLEEPSTGTILINGEDVNARAPEVRQVAMVFQEHSLYPHMTVYQNLAFGLKLRKVARLEIDR